MYKKHNIIKEEHLAGDASTRTYSRLYANDASYILMKQDAFDPSTLNFVLLQKYLKKNDINVPAIIDLDGSAGHILLEDLGDIMLESHPGSKAYYKKTLDELYKLHTTLTTTKDDLCPAYALSFDYEKLKFEFDYFFTNLIQGYLGSNFPYHLIEDDISEICHFLSARKQYFCHRDFHSRNIMLYKDTAYIIDFQDARMGPLSYDLVSLFYDSYVSLNQKFTSDLLPDYLSQFSLPSDFSKEFSYQAIQRGLKACGTFGGQAHLYNKTNYLPYLPKTLLFCKKLIAKHKNLKGLNELLQIPEIIRLISKPVASPIAEFIPGAHQ